MTRAVLTVGAAQTIPVRGDVDANLEQHVGLGRVAAEEGVHALVFPELSLTGYELDLAEELAFSERDPRLDPLVDLARTRGLTPVVGAPVRLASGLHLGAFIISPEGEVEVYTKRHLGAFPASAGVDGTVPPAEASVFRPGDRDALIRLGEHVAAVAVCADTGHPSHPKAAADRGASIYLASMFVIPSEHRRETERLAGHAARHSMTVVFANHGGPSGGLASAGRSAIWSEEGERLVELESTGAGLAVAARSDAGWQARSIALGVAGGG